MATVKKIIRNKSKCRPRWKNTEFLIGADPELLLASPSVWCGDDNKRCGGGSAPFGLDGGEVLVELRPSPSEDPLTVVKNIQAIFQNAVVRYKNARKYKWIVKSIYAGPDEDSDSKGSMGGHIHFGFNRSNYSNKSRDFDTEVKSICSLLDTYVGSITILLENQNDARERRARFGYGAAGDFRTQSYGFEYRTPSSWLSSPHVAAGVLCLAKVVMHEIINNNLTHGPEVKIFPRDINAADTTTMRVKLPRIWEKIQSMKLFPKYRNYIEFLMVLIENNKTWHTNNEVLAEWGINTSPYMKPPAKLTITDIWPASYFTTVSATP